MLARGGKRRPMGTNELVVIYSVVIEQAVKGSRSLIDGIYVRVTVT